MPDREKVIKQLEECLSASCRGFRTCPYSDDPEWDAVETALALLREQEKAGWISVDDRLPENQERVVARLSDTENIVCCFYSPDDWWDIDGMWRLKRPTHWMPVIVDEPPEEVKYAWPD